MSVADSSHAPFALTATRVQSKVEKSPPHTAKLPPILGASPPDRLPRSMPHFHSAKNVCRPTSSQPAAPWAPPHTSFAAVGADSSTEMRAAPRWRRSRAGVGGRVLHALDQVPQAAPRRRPCRRAPPMSSRMRSGQGSRPWSTLAPLGRCPGPDIPPPAAQAGDGAHQPPRAPPPAPPPPATRRGHLGRWAPAACGGGAAPARQNGGEVTHAGL